MLTMSVRIRRLRASEWRMLSVEEMNDKEKKMTLGGKYDLGVFAILCCANISSLMKRKFLDQGVMVTEI